MISLKFLFFSIPVVSLRLCPFESLSFSGASLSEEELASFLDGIESQTSILNATVVQRNKGWGRMEFSRSDQTK